MQTLYFSKTFTSGLLKGLTTHGKISFPTIEGCDGWLKAIKAKAAKGKLPYQITDASFQNYTR